MKMPFDFRMLHAPFAGAVGNLLFLYSWDDALLQ